MIEFRRVVLVAAAGFGLPFFGAACDQKSDAPPAGMPALATGAAKVAAPAKAGVHSPSGENAGAGTAPGLPAGHPPIGTMGGTMGSPSAVEGLPPGHPPMGGPAGPAGAGHAIEGEMPGGEFDPKATLSGTLALSDKVKDQVAAGDVIFLVARQDDGSEKGSILGVKRLTVGSWPQAFQIDGRDAMAPGTKFAGKVLITARVDKDGDAISKNAGDAVGTARVAIPAARIKLTIDTITK